MFEPYKVGAHGDLAISYLQFVDDTLLMGAKCWGNIRILKFVLMLFEFTSGSKVNFHKSILYGVKVSDSWLLEAASTVNMVGFLLYIWGYLLVVIRGRLFFGTL